MYGIQKGELLFSSWVLNTGRNYNLVTNDSSINVELNYELDWLASLFSTEINQLNKPVPNNRRILIAAVFHFVAAEEEHE